MQMTPTTLNAVISEIGNVSKLENGEEIEKKQQVLTGKPAAVAATRMFKRKT